MAYIDNKDGTITDTKTCLMWQQSTFDVMSYDDAVLTCSELDLAGHKDWRLPTYKELFSILDDNRRDPSCDPVFHAQPDFYWSSSWGFQRGPKMRRVVSFFWGGKDVDSVERTWFVRAVRSIKED